MNDQPNTTLAGDFRRVRADTEALVAALGPEDQCVQSMPDASPAKWHRAHTSWFFERFLLLDHLPGARPVDPDYLYLFNSYYETHGARQPRPLRGLITRPDSDAITAYRAAIDAAMNELLARPLGQELAGLVTLGLHHEQQHQELLVTDMLHAFAQTPLRPAVLPGWHDAPGPDGPAGWVSHPGGVVEIGTDPATGFAFDNETPRHPTLLAPYRLANRLVSNADFTAFIADGGYRTATLWMADGWAQVTEQGWQAPLYWVEEDDGWCQMGPGGLAPLLANAPARHLSWYEADAYARWAGARLPTEVEWEALAHHPDLADMTGRVWQWTASAYAPYPGFRAAAGAVGEYNGKFMINQMVLRGSSCITPVGHTRPGYRNFFHPDKRWQFCGLRLAADS